MESDFLFYVGLLCGLILGVFIGRLYEQDQARKQQREVGQDDGTRE